MALVRLYIDLDTQTLVSGLGTRTPVPEIRFKRGDSARIEVQFFRGVTPLQLTAGATGKFALKELNKYDSDPVVSGNWTLEGAGALALYVFSPNFNTEALNDLLFHGDADEDNDVASVVLMGEIEWIVGAAIYSTRTVRVIVDNDVIKDTDGTPLAVETPIDWLGARLMTRTAAQGSPISALVNSVTTVSADPRVDAKTLIYAGPGGAGEYWTESGALPALGDIYLFSDSPTVVQLVAADGDYWANFAPVGAELQPWTDTPLDPQNVGVIATVDLFDGGIEIAGEFLGQFCRLGDATPYEWYQWDGTTWSQRVDPVNTATPTDGGGVAVIAGIKEVVLWNSTQEIYQILRLSGAPGLETPYVSNIL